MHFEVVTIDLHYMTDGTVCPKKNMKIETTAETKTPTSWMPLRKAKTYQKLISK